MNDDEMREMAREMGKIPGMPKPLYLKVVYDVELQKITAKGEHLVVMGEGATFMYLLENVFAAYPDILKRYPPGILYFSVDGVAPGPHTPLFDGDVITFGVSVSNSHE